MSDDIIKIEAEIISPKIETQVGIIWQGAPGRGFVDISSHWLTSDLSLENISIDMEGWVDDIQWVDGSKRFLYKYETITWTSEPTTTLTQPVLVGVWKLPTDLEERLADKVNATAAIRTSLLGFREQLVPCVTFLDDDGSRQFLTKWAPLIQSKNFKMSVAAVLDWIGRSGSDMNWDDLDAIKEIGVEVISHSKTHNYDDTFTNGTEEYIAEDFKLARDALNNHGHSGNILAYPGGTGDLPKVRSAARRIYEAAVISGGGLNFLPIGNHYIRRYALDTNSVPTLANFKSYVDAIVAQNGWLVFMSHSQNTTLNEPMLAIIGDLIDYIRAKGVKIVTIGEGLRIFGNVIEPSSTKGVIDPSGGVHGSGVWGGILDDKVKGTLAKTYEMYNFGITIERISSVNSEALPYSRYGSLETIKTLDGCHQTFRPYNKNELWTRLLPSNSVPDKFKLQTRISGPTSGRSNYVDAGYVYMDTDLGIPVICKTAGITHCFQIEITSGASADGVIAFNGATFNVTSGMTPSEIAAALDAATMIGWSAIQKPKSNILFVYRAVPISASTPTYTDTNGTGVTMTITTIRTGSAPVWIKPDGTVTS